MRYLLDELHTYETSFSDALCPTSRGREQSLSLCSEHADLQPVRVVEMHAFKHDVDRRFDRMDAKMDSVLTTCSELTSAIRSYTVAAASNVSALGTGSTATTTVFSAVTNDYDFQSSGQTLGGTAQSHRPPATHLHSGPPQPNPTQAVGLPPSVARPAAPQEHRVKPVPAFLEAAIPRLPRTKRGEVSIAWKTALDQWYKDDPVTGRRALKDWPREWYTKSMRTVVGVNYLTRKRVADEWEASE